MKFKPMIKTPIFILIALGIWLGGQSLPADSPLTPVIPLKPLKINGSVAVSVRPYDTILSLFVRVRLDGKLVSGLRVTLMDRPAVEESAGLYSCRINGFTPVPGRTVSVAFDKKPGIPSIHAPLSRSLLTAQATIGQLIKITAPLPDAHVPLTPAGMLNVAWAGGNPPYSIEILPFTGADTTGDSVYSQTGVAGTSVSVPLAIFRPGAKFGIYIFSKMDDFRFSAKVDSNSQFLLRQSAAVYIFPE